MRIGTFVTDEKTLGFSCYFEARDIKRTIALFHAVRTKLPDQYTTIQDILDDLHIAECESEGFQMTFLESSILDAFIDEMEAQLHAEKKHEVANTVRMKYTKQKLRPPYHGNA